MQLKGTQFGRSVTRSALGLAISLALTAGAPALANEYDSESKDAESDMQMSMQHESNGSASHPEDMAANRDDLDEVVMEEIRQDPLVSPGRIDVTTTGSGAVTLSGEVSNMLAKERAADIASMVRGVTSVNNTLAVDPRFITDPGRLASAVEDALRRDPATDQFEIDPQVSSDGVVTLLGEVNSMREKVLAGTVALGVKGVTGVRNKIDVDFDGNLSDTALAKSIESALAWDIRVKDNRIHVRVEDNTAYLSGNVSSLMEKRVAVNLASIQGIAEVDASALDVEGLQAVGMTGGGMDTQPDHDQRNNAEQAPATVAVGQSPEAIEQAIARALEQNPRVNSFEINAEVQSGTATLTGTTDNLRAKRTAGLVARHIAGVRKVNNRISVQPAEDLNEQEITGFLKTGIQTSPWLEADQIQVDVEGSVAQLTGSVDNFHERLIAETIAATTPGVTEINNRLGVLDADMVVYDPYLSGANVYVLDWYDPNAGFMVMSDQELAQEIQHEFQWSPYIDAANVDVEVDDGVVTLTGTVPNLLSSQAAVRNALEGGAMRVRNNLEIRDENPELAGTEY